MTITWKVEQLDRELADGYVYQVHYSVNGNDGTYQTRAVGSIGLEKPETLVPFKDLTEETVIGWCFLFSYSSSNCSFNICYSVCVFCC